MKRISNRVITLMFISAPYIFLKVDSINFSLLDILVVIAATLNFYKGFKIGVQSRKYYFFSFSFVFFSLLSVYASSRQTEALVSFFQYIFILFLLFPTLFNVLEFEKFKIDIYKMSTVWSIFALFNLTLQSNPNYYWGGGGGRFVGFFDKPDEIAIITATMIPFLIYSIGESTIARSKSFFSRLVLFGGVGASLVLLLSTGTRSALVGLIIGIFLFWVLRFGISFKFVLSSIVAAITIFLVSSNLDVQRNSLTRLGSGENVSIRLDDYRIALEAASDHLFLGTGIGTSIDVIIQYGGTHRPHNMFLDFLLETGFFGFVSILMLFVLVFSFVARLFINVILKNKRVNTVVAATISSAIIILIAHQFNTISVHRGYWFFWGLCMWISTQKEMFHIKKENLDLLKNTHKNKKIKRYKFVWR